MRSIPLIAVVLLALLPHRDAAASDLNSVAHLINQLGNADFRARQAAFAELDLLGEPALSALKAAAASSDSEIAHKANELIGRIERRLIAARLLAPTLIDVNYDDIPISDAVRDFATRTGLPLVLAGDTSRLRDRRVSFVSGRVPVWQALWGLLQAANLSEWDGVTAVPGLPAPQLQVAAEAAPRVQQFRNRVVVRGAGLPTSNPAPRQIMLYDGPPTPRPVHWGGAIRVRALAANAAVTPQPITENEIVVPLLVSAESKLNWQKAPQVKHGQAIDDHGQKLTATVIGRTGVALSDDDFIINNMMLDEGARQSLAAQRSQLIVMRFAAGDKPSRRLKDVTGTLTLPIRVTGEIAAISDPRNATGKTARGTHGSITVHGFTSLADGAYKADLSIESSTDGPALPWQMGGRNIAMMPNVQVQIQGVVVPQIEGLSVVPANGRATEHMGLSLADADGKKYFVSPAGQQQVTVGPDGIRTRISLTFRPAAGVGEPAALKFVGPHPATVEAPFQFGEIALR